LQKKVLIYPQEFENKIGFDKIRELIINRCKGIGGKKIAEKIFFATDVDFIRNELAIIGEMLEICMLKQDFPINSYPDVSEGVKKLGITESNLSLEEFVEIRNILEITKSVKNFFKKQTDSKFSLLKKITDEVLFPDFVYDRINAVINKKGQIKDNASPELKEIRQNLISENRNVLSKSESILKSIREKGWIDKELSATLVNGRLVLPIESTHKRKIKGFVHDESASGKTSYIEPAEIIDINNHIRELELEEKREIFRILSELTDDIRPYSENLNMMSELLARLDFLYAKALFALDTEAIIPAVDENPGIELVRAKHPLLFLSLKKEIVPTNLRIDKENRILLISGPNAGGKSVAMKTAGLISYMVQCGLPVPVGGTSVIGVFDKIFIDVGDNQSIDNDLSTYSSHLISMKYFLKNSDERTLVLIDEFGSGTDPIIGGTIAEAILQELNNKNVFGVITTHYSNLKIFASNTEGVQNAAMLIDNNKMQPMFILEQGLPGSSYALEIAARSGLPTEIIESAKEKAGPEKTDFDKFMRKVLKDKRYWERKRQNIRKKEKNLEEILEKHLSEYKKLLASKGKILEQAKQESNEMLAEVNKKIENTIREIKESRADKAKTATLRKEMEDLKENIKQETKTEKDEDSSQYIRLKRIQEEKAKKDGKKQPEFVNIDENEIHIGSKVRIIGQTEIGDVVEINEKSVVISFGSMFTSISREKVEKVKKSEQKQQTKLHRRINHEYDKKLLDFKPYIDVRGQRVEEVIKTITEFVDDAIMLDVGEVKILHGKGDGILRKYIRDYLKTYTQIKRIANEEVRFGGDGITVVSFR
jgi:DNA mismatch repair protein MutS2